MSSGKVMSSGSATQSEPTHHAPEFKHIDDMDWEMGRFNNKTKFLFHTRPERPTEPNAGLLRYEPGAGFPLHKHDFAQVWYILEGEFICGGKTYGPGTIVYAGSALRTRDAY
jgi:quercetin dioxygenase-like cupin family protein